MKAALFVLVAVILHGAGPGSSIAHVADQPFSDLGPSSHEPHVVVQIYLRAVERGELKVFDRILDKSMLKPVSVEYVYELDRVGSKVKVYSELRQPLPVPGQLDCTLRGVRATLDANGRIIEINAHIWPE